MLPLVASRHLGYDCSSEEHVKPEGKSAHTWRQSSVQGHLGGVYPKEEAGYFDEVYRHRELIGEHSIREAGDDRTKMDPMIRQPNSGKSGH